MIKQFLIITLMIGSAILGLSAQRPSSNMCTPDSKDDALRCVCTTLHPDFCKSDDPLPSCCRAAEKGGKAKRCGCCLRSAR